jgi:hypothetical protein
MRHVRIARPEKRIRTIREVARPHTLARPIPRSDIAIPTAQHVVHVPSGVSPYGFQSDPYLDYGRTLTPEGGILMIYKDLDVRLRHTIWRMLAWATFTGGEALFLFDHSPLPSHWIKIAVLLIISVVNWLIVAKPVELYRRIEIRPDCMILDGSDIFWRRYLEGDFPACHPDKEGNQVFCGIYGTRFIEYLTIRRFDELDRMPEVFSAHLLDAMRQLWTRPQ